MNQKPRQTPKNERNAKIARIQRLHRKSKKTLMNQNHPLWKPGVEKLLVDLMKREDDVDENS